MIDLALRTETLKKVKNEITQMIYKGMQADIEEIILYGSCARGDYSEDSDIDIALLLNCDRIEAKKYSDLLADIATEMAMKYFVIINFACLPYEEYLQKRSWYPYFINIDSEGEVLYG